MLGIKSLGGIRGPMGPVGNPAGSVEGREGAIVGGTRLAIGATGVGWAAPGPEPGGAADCVPPGLMAPLPGYASLRRS